MNILLIAIDTLRADRLSCYGYQKKTTPNLDRFAREGIKFNNFFSQNSFTQPAFTTIYSGKYPITHNIVAQDGDVDLDDKISLLPEILQDNGYKTAAIDNLEFMKDWFTRGYDRYINPCKIESINPYVGIKAEIISDYAIDWLADNYQENFFLFLHYWDPHMPYLPPTNQDEKFRTESVKDGRTLKDVMREPVYSFVSQFYKEDIDIGEVQYKYDAEINYMDQEINRVVQFLIDQQVLDDTLVLFTADHGESLGEHGIYFDHIGLYDQSIQIPLIIRYPNLAVGKEINSLTEQVDLAPTILDIAGLKDNDTIAEMEGQSLLSLIKGKQDKKTDYIYANESSWQCKRTIRSKKWKFIKAIEADVFGNPMQELYDLEKDPFENNNLAKERKEVADKLEKQMQNWVTAKLQNVDHGDPLKEQGCSKKLHPNTKAEEEKIKKRLEEFGY
jgi:arylsulfatase A-like enzyme